MAEIWSGGCQCGAVRYRFSEKPTGAHLCHCRMCQKAFGGLYAPLVGGPLTTFAIIRGALKTFASSDVVERGFCDQCGTPLTFSHADGLGMSVSIGSLDDPAVFPPVDQHGIESRLSYVNGLGQLPDIGTTEQCEPQIAAVIKATSHQHPDQDTADWPPKEQK